MKPYKYQLVAQQIEKDILTGRLITGSRLPSVRRFARNHGLSTTTALSCYRQLEAAGYLQAKPQSGFYVRRALKQLAEPVTQRFYPQARSADVNFAVQTIQYEFSHRPSVPMGIAALGPEMTPVDLLNRSLVRATRRAAARSQGYGPSMGDPGLRNAISARANELGFSIGADDLLITSGCMESVSLAIRATTQPGDVVAVPTPCFSGLLQLLETLDRKVMEIAISQQDGIDIPQLAEMIEQQRIHAFLFTANNQNPLGYTLSITQKQALAELCNRHRFPFIEDDVFSECFFEDDSILPVKAYDTDGYVVYCNSVSKVLAPGYRIGWCAPGQYAQQVKRLRISSSIITATPTQLAVADFMHCGEYEKHLTQLRRLLAQEVDRLSQAIHKYFPPAVKVSRPKGGYLLWLELPKSIDSFLLHKSAAEQGIYIMPGSVFSVSGLFDNYIRLNAGNRWGAHIETAVEWLGKQISKQSSV